MQRPQDTRADGNIHRIADSHDINIRQNLSTRPATDLAGCDEPLGCLYIPPACIQGSIANIPGPQRSICRGNGPEVRRSSRTNLVRISVDRPAADDACHQTVLHRRRFAVRVLAPTGSRSVFSSKHLFRPDTANRARIRSCIMASPAEP